MSEHGIIMAAPSILAYQAGRKTQARRLAQRWMTVKEGDRFWFRETHAFIWPKGCQDGWVYDDDDEPDGRGIRRDECSIEYRADTADKYPGGWPDDCGDDPVCVARWKASIHMPRWVARYAPVATADARLERLQEISARDEEAEGCFLDFVGRGLSYRALWAGGHTTSGQRWEDNPMVVVLEFAGANG